MGQEAEMHPEDKARLDAWLYGLADLGLEAEQLTSTTWLLKGSGSIVAKITYDSQKPFAERFNYQAWP